MINRYIPAGASYMTGTPRPDLGRTEGFVSLFLWVVCQQPPVFLVYAIIISFGKGYLYDKKEEN